MNAGTGQRLAAGEVLIVEDTPASLRLLADLLGHAGYVTRQAQDGRMALLSAQSRPPDLILLDVRMPGLDGFEVCARLKEDARSADVPVIFLSALDATEDKIKAFRLGAVDYIAKPYQPEEVLARVHTHVELRRLQSRLEDRVAERTAQYREAQAQLQASKVRLHELAGFLQGVREEERARIARELHDELGQSLTALRIDLSWLRGKCAEAEPGIGARLANAQSLVENTMEGLRRIAEDLRPRMLDDLGLAAAIEHHVGDFAQRTGIPCELALNREEFAVSGPTATAVFRIIQEALTNIARHADASRVEVSVVQEGDGIELRVGDDGRGIVGQGGNKTFGLLGMEERVKTIGGRLTIASESGHGTTIEAWLPAGSGEGDDDQHPDR